MRKKILYPIDFSENSLNAIDFGQKLYGNIECDFFIFNAFSTSGDYSDVLNINKTRQNIYDEAKATSENQLADLLKTLRDNYENEKHTFSSISEMGDPVDLIKEIVERKDVDVIIMGTKGSGNAKNRAFGSTAMYVMEKVRNCPTIVVPESKFIKLPKEIVFPTSYKTHFKKRELIHLIEIAMQCNAAIRILHVSEEDELNENQKEKRSQLEEYFEDILCSFHTLTNIKVPTAVNCFVESRESDMVVFINKKHTFFGSLLTNPLVKGVSYHSKVPILVLHDLRN